MISINNFFFIDLEFLPKNENIFPFHLYLFNPVNKQYIVFLYANSPLEPQKYQILSRLISKGAKLAVAITQKRTFLENLKKEEHEVPSLLALMAEKKDISEEERAELQKKLRMELTIKDGIDVIDGIKNSVDNNDFRPFIMNMKNEILEFPLNISPTTSLSVKLTEKILNEDNLNNRVVALSYALAKAMGIKKILDLSELLCAAYLHHIGLTQLDFHYSSTPLLNLNDNELKDFKKHPGLTQHLIRKSGIELSSRAVKIILEHHEREDGTGYPMGKKGTHIDPLAQMLGMVGHVVEYSSGLISGTPIPLKQLGRSYANKSQLPGLDYKFSPPIQEMLANLIKGINEPSKKSA